MLKNINKKTELRRVFLLMQTLCNSVTQTEIIRLQRFYSPFGIFSPHRSLTLCHVSVPNGSFCANAVIGKGFG